jgi:hypothetical protein
MAALSIKSCRQDAMTFATPQTGAVLDTGNVASDDRDELALAPALAVWTVVDGNITRYPESHYLDFVINGQSLSSIAADAGLGELVTPFNRPWLESVPTDIDRFLGRQIHPELAASRIAILVCAVCGDLGCGAVTAHLAVTDTTVIWSEWAIEDARTQAQPVNAFGPPAVFDRSRYEAGLATTYAQLAELPYDELAHRGRRFLWPWQWGWRLPR